MCEKNEFIVYTIWLRMGRVEFVLSYKFITEITESIKPLFKLLSPQPETSVVNVCGF